MCSDCTWDLFRGSMKCLTICICCLSRSCHHSWSSGHKDDSFVPKSRLKAVRQVQWIITPWRCPWSLVKVKTQDPKPIRREIWILILVFIIMLMQFSCLSDSNFSLDSLFNKDMAIRAQMAPSCQCHMPSRWHITSDFSKPYSICERVCNQVTSLLSISHVTQCSTSSSTNANLIPQPRMSFSPGSGHH